MILVYDVGNTNIKTGVFDGNTLVSSWRQATVKHRTSDEMGVNQCSFFEFNKLSINDIDGVIISSVVPSLNYTIEHMVRYFFKLEPMLVSSSLKSGLKLLYDNPSELGADRICNAAALYAKYGGPSIVIDFGTATTLGAVSSAGEFLGGAICPGLKVATDALSEQASRLPRVEIVHPASAINRSTVSAMQAGIVFGTVGQVDYIVEKMKDEMGGGDIKVVATGGLSRLISESSRTIETIDPYLTLEGLRIIYEMNH